MKAADLRGILTYIPSFRDKLFVLSVDSAVLEDERAASLFLDISVLRSLNIRVVLVHGASARIKKIAGEMKVKVTNLDGLGVTDEATLQVAERASNSYSHDILQNLADADLRGAVTNAVIAHPAGILGGVDQQWTGRVERVDTRFLETLLENGIIPVIPPMGVDGDGRTYRGEFGRGGVGGGGGLEGGEADFSDGEWFFTDEREETGAALGGRGDRVAEEEKGGVEWGDRFQTGARVAGV